MSIDELIKELNKVPKEKRKLPIYVYDYKEGDNLKIDSISLFNNIEEHNKENMLSININQDFY